MKSDPFVFILAGGRGERLWPLSTGADRKPFLKLFEGKSLLELTLARLEGVTERTKIRILTAMDLREAVEHCVPDFPREQILCEPEGRNTAAAIAYACGMVLKEAPDATAIVLPADHLIENVTAFRAALTTACELAQMRQEIVTIGIHPTAPATTYGYIACSAPIKDTGETKAYAGVGFTEKPDLATAKTYLATGHFFWNAGIFVWTATTLREHFQISAPEFLPLIDTPEQAASHYPALPAIAFDYAIMEHCATFSVVEGSFEWDDAGTLEALERHLPADAAGNRAAGEAHFVETTHCTVLSTDATHRILLAGVDGLTVTHSKDVTFICPRKELSAQQARIRKQFDSHSISIHSEVMP
jgi:mannose-1-phosphate guanylyltransferase